MQTSGKKLFSPIELFRIMTLAFRSIPLLRRAKAAGKQFGRPPALNTQQRAAVVAGLEVGASIAELAREFKTTRQTIMRVREAALKLPL